MDTKKIEMLKRIARGIVGIFGDRCEVVIHDFSDITQSVVHIEGNVTNRSVGAPVTSTMMRMLKEFGDQVPDKIAYKITTEDGKVLKCASMFMRDETGKLEGCLAINFNISDFRFFVQAFSDFALMPRENNHGANGDAIVRFSKKPAESMETIIDATVAKQGKPTSIMDKAEKKEIVQKLDKAGVFAIKGSVNYLARVLGSSRYTVYNYLKEVRES